MISTMDMQAIIDDWKANAKKHNDRNLAFLRSLKMKDERAVDRAAKRLHDEAFSIIDCTRCANCCKKVSPVFRKADVQRIAEHLGMTAADFKAEYLQADEDGDLHLKNLPLFVPGGGRPLLDLQRSASKLRRISPHTEKGICWQNISSCRECHAVSCRVLDHRASSYRVDALKDGRVLAARRDGRYYLQQSRPFLLWPLL